MKKIVNKSTKFVAATLAFVMLLSASIPAGARKLKDVSATDWALDAINYVVDNGYYPTNDYFYPNDTLCRIIAASMLYYFDGAPSVTPRKIYSDVACPGSDALETTWAYDNGIMYGTTATEFEPYKNITRQDFAVVLYRYAARKGYDTSKGNGVSLSGYTDAGNVSDYAMNAIKWAIGSRVMGGTSSNTLEPQKSVTQREAAEFLRKFGIYSAKIRWGTDNFSFINNNAFTKYGNNYYLTENHYNYLLADLQYNGDFDDYKRNVNGTYEKDTLTQYLQYYKNEMNWGGSCYGMVTVMALCKWGKLDMVGNFGTGSETTLYDLDASEDVISAINYYQFTQCIPKVGSWAYAMSASDPYLKSIFNVLPDAIDQLGVVPFAVIYDMSGKSCAHEILLNRYEINGNKITIYYFDPNMIGEQSFYYEKGASSYQMFEKRNEKGEIVAKGQVKNVYMPQYRNRTINDMFLCYDIYDLDMWDNESGGATYAQNNLSNKYNIGLNDNTYLTVRLAGEFVIENAEGERLIYSGGEFSGDLKIISEAPIIAGGDEAVQMRLEVKNSDSFRLTTENDDTELTVLNSDIFSVGKGSGVREISIFSDGAIAMDGDRIDYEMTTFVRDLGTEMFTVSGKSEKRVSIDSEASDLSLSGIEEECVITTYSYNNSVIKKLPANALNNAKSAQAILDDLA